MTLTMLDKPLAVFSEDRIYRYILRCQISPLLGAGTCAFIMCNPSTADEHQDDPTIRRCIDFARSWGYAELVVLNLFAYRSMMDPALLRTKGDPVGPMNDGYIWSAAGTHLRCVSPHRLSLPGYGPRSRPKACPSPGPAPECTVAAPGWHAPLAH